MEFNPSRSWAVTYNQMWNLSMTNPLSGFNHGSHNNTQRRSGGFVPGGSNTNNNAGRRKLN